MDWYACHGNRERDCQVLDELMNKLIELREKQKKVDPLHQAELLNAKNERISTYNQAKFIDRQSWAREDIFKREYWIFIAYF